MQLALMIEGQEGVTWEHWVALADACEAHGVDYIFGLGGNDVLDRKVEATADDVRVRWAEGQAPVMRRYAETRYGAAS